MRRRWRLRWLGVIWVAYLIVPAATAADLPEPRRSLGIALAAAFAFLYAAAILTRGQRWRSQYVPIVLLVISVAGPPIFGKGWSELAIFALLLPLIMWPWSRALPITVIVFAYEVVGIVWFNWDGATDHSSTIFSLGAGVAAITGVAGLIRTNAQLREARGELAHLAVTEERLRFARDLHDLLGHGLTTIVVKTELAAKLTDVDPPRAAAELADIQRIARQALADVRETVAGYRGLTLAAEIEGARRVLAAAGVTCVARPPERPLPVDVEAALAWVVREGTTNVLRHSHATACEITIGHVNGAAELHLVDNGVARVAQDAHPASGHGLQGLHERLAAVDGTLEAGPGPDGGFRLRAWVPVAT